jgi:hypothetical protein
MRTCWSLIAIALTLCAGTPLGAAEQNSVMIAQASAPADAAPATPIAPPVAAPAGAPPAAAVPPPAPATKLSGLPAWTALVGNSITGQEDGKTVVEYYAADGSVKSMTGNEITAGTWALVGETVCIKYGNEETECYKLEVVGKDATFTDAKGNGLRYEILKGNPKNL